LNEELGVVHFGKVGFQRLLVEYAWICKSIQEGTPVLPIDCVGQLQSGTSTPIDVVIKGCTTEQALVPATGQTTCYNSDGDIIDCAGTGQDGDWKAGVPLPTPRFTDNLNGTITDNLTKLIWLKDAGCTDQVGGIEKSLGWLIWADALTWSNNLADGSCGLTDDSTIGQWRLPNVRELQSLVDYGIGISSPFGPVLPSGHPFKNVWEANYWSSTTEAGFYLSTSAFAVNFYNGSVEISDKTVPWVVTAVRGGP
jgi:hypothetical protein